MGLDIRIDISRDAFAEKLREEIEYADGDDDRIRAEKDLAHFERSKVREFSGRLDLCPGSYSGTHRVRRLYAMKRGWPIGGRGYVDMGEENSPQSKSHLCHHSDCDGYYLPSDFNEPQWLLVTLPDGKEGRVSVGSSYRLLAELREIEDATKDDLEQYAWDQFYMAALASVVGNRVAFFE